MHQIVYDMAADAVAHVVDMAIKEASPALESPLEQVFLEALLVLHMTMFQGLPPINNVKPTATSKSAATNPKFSIKTQHEIGRYRADFLLVSWTGSAVVVECDGHDFHERTKEQAARDRQKDRDIQAAGHMILRFTGSEIWADPFKCAGDAICILFQAKPMLKSQSGAA